MTSNNKLLLLDTFYFLHRSFHAYPKDLKSPLGESTNIIFGFAMSLLDSISEFNPTHIACGWESEDQPSFRKVLYPKYQITRAQMEIDDEKLFSEQLPKIVELLEAFNIPRLSENGFEGDDVVGTIANIASENAKVIISTADKDLLQLITDEISVYRPASGQFIKKQLFDEKAFIEKYQFSPRQMIDYKALRGDPSDNIPGVKGIGDKGAKSLILEFGELQKIYDNIENIKSESIKQKLIDSKDDAFMSKQLATIITNIPMKFNLNDCVVHDFDIDKVRMLFNRYGFNSLNKRLDRLELIKGIKEKEQKYIENAQQSFL